MCGRYTLTAEVDQLQGRFEFDTPALTYTPSYNIDKCPLHGQRALHFRLRFCPRLGAAHVARCRSLRSIFWKNLVVDGTPGDRGYLGHHGGVAGHGLDCAETP